MNYIIYRLPGSNDAKFMSIDWCKRNGCLPDKSDYVMIYVGQIYNSTESGIERKLDYIYSKLNINHPMDYHLPSLSISDVIGVEVGKRQWEYYYVDDIGFKRIWEKN